MLFLYAARIQSPKYHAQHQRGSNFTEDYMSLQPSRVIKDDNKYSLCQQHPHLANRTDLILQCQWKKGCCSDGANIKLNSQHHSCKEKNPMALFYKRIKGSSCTVQHNPSITTSRKRQCIASSHEQHCDVSLTN